MFCFACDSWSRLDKIGALKEGAMKIFLVQMLVFCCETKPFIFWNVFAEICLKRPQFMEPVEKTRKKAAGLCSLYGAQLHSKGVRKGGWDSTPPWAWYFTKILL